MPGTGLQKSAAHPRAPGKARRGQSGPGPESQGFKQPRRGPQPLGAGPERLCSPRAGPASHLAGAAVGMTLPRCAFVCTHVCVFLYGQGMTHTSVCVCVHARTSLAPSGSLHRRVACGERARALWGPGGEWSRRPGTDPAKARGSVVPETSPEAQLCSSPAQTSVPPRPQQTLERQAFSFPAFVGLSVASPYQLARRTQSLCALGCFRPQAGHRSALCPQPAHARVCGVDGPAWVGVGWAVHWSLRFWSWLSVRAPGNRHCLRPPHLCGRGSGVILCLLCVASQEDL